MRINILIISVMLLKLLASGTRHFLQDPIHLFSHLGVYSWSALSTSFPPADHTPKLTRAASLCYQWTSCISLTGSLSCIAGANHVASKFILGIWRTSKFCIYTSFIVFFLDFLVSHPPSSTVLGRVLQRRPFPSQPL